MDIFTLSPDNFILTDGKAKVTKKEVTPDKMESLKGVIAECPAKAISFK